MNQGASQRRTSYRLLLTTLWATLLLFAVEAISGWASQSLTLLAEALHTLIDGFSTGLSLVAIMSPQRQMGREVWGHGRGEVGATLMLCGFLGFTGVSLLIIAMRQLYSTLAGGEAPLSVMIQPQVLQLTAALVIFSISLHIYSSYQAQALNSLTLRLNTRHFLQDAWLSVTMLAVLLGIWRGQQWLDPLFALVLLPLVARSLWRVLQAQLPLLLQPTAIAPEAIAHVVTQIDGVTHCIRIRSRGMVGRQVWIELSLAIHPEFVEAASVIAEQVEAALRQRYGPLKTQIWMEESSPRQEWPYGLNPYNPPPAGAE